MKFYANPFNPDAQGFYFDTFEEYQENVELVKSSFGNPVDEFEIQVIDGSKKECDLVKAIMINQVNLEEVMEYIDTSDEDEWPMLFFILDNNICDNLEDAKNNVNDYSVVKENLLDVATEIFDECYLCVIPEEHRNSIQRYINYESFANDCKVGGDLVEFEFGGDTYTCTNANQ